MKPSTNILLLSHFFRALSIFIKSSFIKVVGYYKVEIDCFVFLPKYFRTIEGDKMWTRIQDAVFSRILLPRNYYEQHLLSENFVQEEKLTKLAKHPQYSLEATRLSSYSKWPITSPQTPVILCDAGFFYTGMKAFVIFWCKPIWNTLIFLSIQHISYTVLVLARVSVKWLMIRTLRGTVLNRSWSSSFGINL